MLQEYKFVRGKEIETYQDILDCEEDGIILSDLAWGDCHHDIDILLRKNETLTMKRLQQIKDEGYSVYQRARKYRDVVFSKDIDVELSDILLDFAYDYEDSYTCLDEEILQNTLVRLKNIISK